MIYTFGSAPFNKGKPFVNYGALTPTGFPAYNDKSMSAAQVSGVHNELSRSQNSHFYQLSTTTAEIFNSHNDHGQIKGLLIVNVGSATPRIYLNEEDDYNVDAVVLGPNGGFTLASGESIQIDYPVTHIGQVGDGNILYHGSLNYNYNTI